MLSLRWVAKNLEIYKLGPFKVNEVVGVMRNNIDKVLERDSKLNDLDYR